MKVTSTVELGRDEQATMPISKATREKLDAWKDGKGEYPTELDNGVFFNDEGAFLAEADRKGKAKLTDAERRATSAAREAREAALVEILAKAGVKDADELADIKARLAAADGTATELETLKAEKAKLERDAVKENAKLVKEIAELSGFKTKVIKDQAIAPHLAKVHPDFRDLVAENLSGKLVIEGDKITMPGGKEIGAYVDETLAAKPSLKAPDYKAGAGTKPGEKAGDPNGKPKADPKEVTVEKPRGTPEELQKALSASFAEQREQIAASGQ